MENMKTVIISPHLDDAVLSLGQYIATRFMSRTTVVTVCAGRPDPSVLSDYDRDRGFTSSAQSVDARAAEDIAASEVLGYRWTHLPYLDGQYGDTIDFPKLVADLARYVRSDTRLFAPLGIGHPDHRLVATACRAACVSGELCLYEELPYRVMWPDEAHYRLERVRWEGFTIDALPMPLEVGPRDLKAKAIAAYASQFPDGADDPCVLVPERVWRATR